MVRICLTIPVLVVSLAIAFAGCGDDAGSSEAGSSSSFDAGSSLAKFASPGSVVFVEGEVKPEGEMKSNVDSVTSTLTGEDNLGEFVASKLEDSALENGETFNYEREVKPWLGKAAAVAFKKVEATGDLSAPLIMIETEDEEATLKFLEAHVKGSGKDYEYTSYNYVGINTGGPEHNSIGVFDGALVIADNAAEFKAAITASDGNSLADEAHFADAISAASEASFASAYIDVGEVIKQSADRIDSQAKEILESSGIDPSEATAVASVIPGADQIEVDLSSDLGGEKAPSGDVSKLLGTMPAGSVAAFAVSGFGEQLEEAIDNLDESGIQSGLPPNKLKSTLSEAGIDLDKIAASLEDAAVYAEGNDRESLGGALVVTADGDEAEEAIAGLGTLLRGAKVPGVTAVSGKASGFSIRGAELGSKPIVVIAENGRIAIGYGLAETLQGIEAGSGSTLSGSATYKAAVSSLGDTPISAFVDGASALRLAEALVPRSKTDFWEAVPYLKKIEYLALGASESDEPATAKLIAGLEK